VALFVRVAVAALVAYVVTGLVYAAGVALMLDALRKWPFFVLPSPWKSGGAFVGWFVEQTLSWPSRLFPIHGLWEIVVPTVFLAALWLVYRALPGRSARLPAAVVTLLTRLVVAAVVAYIFIGLVYATWETITLDIFGKNAGALAPPWSGPMAFLAWFVLPAALWPWNLIGFRGLPEILVACVYLATVGLFYLAASLAASRRSAPRRLKSTHPNTH
jgi:hypothetical protein